MFTKEDWTEEDLNSFKICKFKLLTYQQICLTKIGDLERADNSSQKISNLLKIIEQSSNLNTFYAIGEVEMREFPIQHIANYNKVLLSLMKNRFCSTLIRKNKKLSGLSKS